MAWKIAQFGRINVDANGEPVIGEVQASPTSNTLLDRLKTIATNLGAVVLAAGSAVIGKVRLVTATGDEVTDDTADAVKAKLVANSGVDVGDVDILSIAAGDNNIGNVDIASALPAGTNAIGKLAANSGIDIGDVDVLSIAAGDNNIGNVDIVTVPAPLNVTGTGVELGALRVTLATDSTGVVSVDDNGANLSIDDGGNAITIDWAGTAPPIGAGLEATALRVTLATDSTGVVSVDDNGASLTVDVGTALPAGTNAIGKLAANSGIDIGDVDVLSIAAGDNNIGNVDIASALPTGTNAIGRVGHDTTGLGHGVTVVTTAGTDVVLASTTACKWVVIQAQTDNTNKIAVGATGVDATVATGTGIILDPGDSVTIQIDNLADIYIDSLVSGEGCRYFYGS